MYPQVYLLAHDIQTLLAELETDFLTIFLEGHYDHSLMRELMQSRRSDKKLAKVPTRIYVIKLLYSTIFDGGRYWRIRPNFPI